MQNNKPIYEKININLSLLIKKSKRKLNIFIKDELKPPFFIDTLLYEPELRLAGERYITASAELGRALDMVDNICTYNNVISIVLTCYPSKAILHRVYRNIPINAQKTNT